MPALKNARHERFAQEVAKGKPAYSAYEIAGYKENPSTSCAAASRLLRKSNVTDRISEIVNKVAVRAEITLESLMQEADEIQRVAMECQQLSAANGALTVKAKLAGLWIERKEIGRPGEFESMNADELRAYIYRENAELGVGVAPLALTDGTRRSN